MAAVTGGEARGALIVGPAACGKSLAARTAVAGCGLVNAQMDCALLATCGDAERADELLLGALLPFGGGSGRGVLLLDGLDAMLPAVAVARTTSRVLAVTVLDRLRDLMACGSVFVLATAPSVSSLSSDVAALFGARVFRVSPPDEEERGAILASLLGREAESVARLLRGYSGGDLRKVALWAALESEQPSDEDLLRAAAVLRPSALMDLERLDTAHSFADVAGLEKQKGLLRAAVLTPLREPERCTALGVAMPGGVVLCGPHGSGKTLLANALAGECKLPVVVVRGPDVISSVVGESEKRVALLFERARQCAPSIMLLDQMESIVPASSAANSLTQTQSRVVSCMASELDACARHGVVAVATVAQLSQCSASVLQRFELRVALPPPSQRYSEQVLELCLKRVRSAVSADEREAVAQGCAALSAAAVAAVCNEAAMVALRRAIAAGSDDPVVRAEDLLEACRVFVS